MEWSFKDELDEISVHRIGEFKRILSGGRWLMQPSIAKQKALRRAKQRTIRRLRHG